MEVQCIETTTNKLVAEGCGTFDPVTALTAEMCYEFVSSCADMFPYVAEKGYDFTAPQCKHYADGDEAIIDCSAVPATVTGADGVVYLPLVSDAYFLKHEKCITYTPGEGTPASCKDPKPEGTCAFDGPDGNVFMFTIASGTQDADGEYCAGLKKTASYTLEDRTDLCGMDKLSWTDVCPIHYVADPANYENTSKEYKCLYDGEETPEEFCEVNVGNKPEPSGNKCTVFDIKSNDFVSTPSCALLFKEDGASLDDSHLGDARCLVSNGTLSATIEARSGLTCTSSTFQSCLEKVSSYGTNPCADSPEFYYKIKDTTGDDEIRSVIVPQHDSDDFDYMKVAALAGCSVGSLVIDATFCDGKYINATALFGGATTCVWKDGESSVNADIRFCQANLPLSTPEACSFKHLSAAAARPSTCTELFPKVEADGKALVPATDPTESCWVLNVNGDFVEVAPAAGDVPDACGALKTVAATSCAIADFPTDSTCYELNISDMKCTVSGGDYEFENTVPCADAYASARSARAQNADCTAENYSTQVVERDCTYDANSATKFTAASSTKATCHYKSGETTQAADAEFCSQIKSGATAFSDVKDGKVVIDCQLSDYVEWRDTCADVFGAKGSSVVAAASYSPVCVATFGTIDTFYVDTQHCVDAQLTKPDDITFDDCDSDDFKFNKPGNADLATFDCTSASGTSLIATNATCTVVDVPIVDDAGKPDFTRCAGLKDYTDYVYNPPEAACAAASYAWVYSCNKDYVEDGAEQFAQGVTTTSCKFGNDSAEDNFCSFKFGSPNTNNGEACKFEDLPASLFVATPTCATVFDENDSDPSDAYCLLKSKMDDNKTVRIPAAADGDLGYNVPACKNNKKVLGDCVEKHIIVDEFAPCTTPIQSECIIKDSPAGNLIKAHAALTCGGVQDLDWSYDAQHFVDKACDAGQLSVDNKNCDGTFVDINVGFSGATNCAYGTTGVAKEFCLNNNLVDAAECTLQMLSNDAVSDLKCDLLYPDDGEGAVASNAEVPRKCFILAKDGNWISITAEQATAHGGLPSQCDGIDAKVTSRAECTAIKASEPDCTHINLDDWTCVVKGTDVEFLTPDTDPTCKTKLQEERQARAASTATCKTNGAYVLQAVDSSQCVASLTGADPQQGYLSEKSATPAANGVVSHCIYRTDSDAPASIEFCSQKNDLSDISEDGTYISGTCSLLDCGLRWNTEVCALRTGSSVKVTYTACVIRTDDGAETEVSPDLCLGNLSNEEHKYACKQTPIQWVDRADEVTCSSASPITNTTVTTQPHCAIFDVDGQWHFMKEDDTDVHSSYWTLCETELGTYPDSKEIRPSPCVASAYWKVGSCSTPGTDATYTCEGASEDSVCQDNFGNVGKDVLKCIAPEAKIYDWYADVGSGCNNNDCGVASITWKCKETTEIRKTISPLDPLSAKITYSDIASAVDADDAKCTALASKPSFTQLPCPCAATQVGSGPLVYDGKLKPFAGDGILARTPECNDDNGACPVLEKYILTNSMLSSVYRAQDDLLDVGACDESVAQLDGASKSGVSRACTPASEIDAFFWTRNYGEFDDESACSAPCNIKDKAVALFAYSCARRVIVDGDVKVVLVGDEHCAGIQKPQPPACNQHDCVKAYNWVASAWKESSGMSKVERCDAGTYQVTRDVDCLDMEGNVSPSDKFCDASKKPETTQNVVENCGTPMWLASSFSACRWSASSSVATRVVMCVVFAADGKRYVQVPDSNCQETKPAETTECCLNGGTRTANGCVCKPGTYGKACEYAPFAGIEVHVPNYQTNDEFFYSAPLLFGSQINRATIDLVLASTDEFFARVASNVTIHASGVLEYFPKSDEDAFHGETFKLRITSSSLPTKELFSNSFILNRSPVCENGGVYLPNSGICACPDGTPYSGKFCHVNSCSKCDPSVNGCKFSGGVLTNCCAPDSSFNNVVGSCVKECSSKVCANDGVAVEDVTEGCVCMCPSHTSWLPSSDCTTCALSCGANGKADENCVECICNRGYSSELGICDCRSLIVRIGFIRSNPLSLAERLALSSDLAEVLYAEDVNVDRIMVSEGTVRGSRLAVDITIRAKACVPSNQEVAKLLTKVRPASWFKSLDNSDDFKVEFESITQILVDAFENPETLPSSFASFDAALGASIADPGCIDPSQTCMDPATTGAGGPPLNPEESGSDDDDLKWIVPIAVLIPLAVIITGVVLYVKCAPSRKTTTSAATLAQPDDVELTTQ